MRSSVACARCRRSKIKCINNGIDSVCVPCHQNKRDCTYPAPSVVSSSSTKRSEHPSGMRADGEGETKRPRKREADAAGKQLYRIGEDPLENPPISSKLWGEIYSLFKLHYSAELSFLHEPTFFDRIERMQESGSRSRETELLLLGMLSLTARFVPELVSYSYPSDPSQHTLSRVGHPLNASEFYAHALATRLDSVTMATPSLDVIQALLMLGLHNWGMCRGLRSWMLIGDATRLAYAMGLSSEEDLSNASKPDSVSMEEVERLGVKRKLLEAGPKLDSKASVTREIKRRIMWSCFILDRYLSSGRARPQMSAETLHIQLPCSGKDFRFCRAVKTEFLHPGGDCRQDNGTAIAGQFPTVHANSVLSIYIRLVEIWGRFSKWSCAGGRRQERYIPPWDERTEFFKLRKQLDDFEASLPLDLTFSSANLAAHVGGSTMTVYTAIHTLCSLCKIVLHREYIPFIPLRCDRPIGPLDEPTFPKEKYDVPDGFWEESAEQIFKAAKDIMEIVRANSPRGLSIESPQVAFAIWTAAFVGVYSLNFPHMDLAGHMNGKESTVDFGDTGETVKGATGLAVRTLTQMSSRLKMAYGWSKTIKRIHEYFSGIIADYTQNSLTPLSQGNQPRSLLGARSLSLREGGRGGGLEEYKLLEKELKEFGSIEDNERHSTPVASETAGSRASTSGLAMTPLIKAETMQTVERHPPGRSSSEGSWAPVINNASGGIDDIGHALPYSYYGAHHGSPNAAQHTARYHQQQQMLSKGPTSNPIDLIGVPQNSVGLNSSYAQSELVHVLPPDSYPHSPQPLLPGYQHSAQHTFGIHYAGDSQDWVFDSHLSGVTWAMWAPDGQAASYEMDMQTIPNPQSFHLDA